MSARVIEETFAQLRETMAPIGSVDPNRLATDEPLKENPTISKAEALRQAQLSFIHKGDKFREPYYWTPFILVGTWL